ncbi:MAG: lysozyme inhibitor LprI family protein [Verrucomicrobiota bacterium]
MFATLAVAFVSSAVCFAQEPKEPNQGPPNLQEGAKREFEEADAKLRGRYEALLTQLDVDQRKVLDDAHAQWLAFRETAAKAMANLTAPSEEHYALLEFLELHRLTEQRLEALERIIEARRTAG